MNGKISLTLIAAASVLACAAQGRAETIRGNVISSNADSGSIVMRRSQPRGQGLDRVRIFSDEDTRLVGIDSLGELEAGSEIFVDADRAGNSYQASSIRSGGTESRSERIRAAADELAPAPSEIEAQTAAGTEADADRIDYTVQDIREDQLQEPYRF